MRNIDITKQTIWCCDDIYYEDNGVSVCYELWFDVDAYFGTNTNEDDSAWVNFYTYYNKDGSITAKYEVDTDDEWCFEDWELTEIEQEFFRDKMEKYCRKRYGQTIEELLMECE